MIALRRVISESSKLEAVTERNLKVVVLQMPGWRVSNVLGNCTAHVVRPHLVNAPHASRPRCQFVRSELTRTSALLERVFHKGKPYLTFPLRRLQ